MMSLQSTAIFVLWVRMAGTPLMQPAAAAVRCLDSLFRTVCPFCRKDPSLDVQSSTTASLPNWSVKLAIIQ